MSANQLHRMLGVTLKTEWFMAHRIRHGMAENIFAAQLEGDVGVDETYVGGKTKGKGRAYKGNRTPVVALVEKGGSVRPRVVADVTAKTLHSVIKEEVAAEARIMTDEHLSIEFRMNEGDFVFDAEPIHRHPYKRLKFQKPSTSFCAVLPLTRSFHLVPIRIILRRDTIQEGEDLACQEESPPPSPRQAHCKHGRMLRVDR